MGNFGIGQGAVGFAINTNHLTGIKDFYDKVAKNYKELFLYDDLWISYFLYFFKKSKILSLGKYLKKGKDGKPSLIYKTHIIASGLVETYGKSFFPTFKRVTIGLFIGQWSIGGLSFQGSFWLCQQL